MAEQFPPGKHDAAKGDTGDADEPGGAEAAPRRHPAILPATLPEAHERIAELVADLHAARTTIQALLDRAERRTPPSGVITVAEADEDADQHAGQGDGQGDSQKNRAMSAWEAAALPEGGGDLDKLIRQQTRALAESESQLRRKNSELKRLNEMKAEFISIAAHELRTPLTSIVGYLDLMQEGRFGTTPEAMARPIASLQRNAQRLRRLVDEMLDVSHIEQGQVHLYKVPCDLGEIVKAVVADLGSLAAAKRLVLTAAIDRPPLIEADVERIRQAVSKLISSTIRHTPEGGSIAATVDEAPQERFAGSWTRLQVRHSGIGIPRHLHGRIFEPFFDVQSAKHHTSSGPDSAGLGLYIARGLIDLHGGLITVDSEEGAFTEFTVLLPMMIAQQLQK